MITKLVLKTVVGFALLAGSATYSEVSQAQSIDPNGWYRVERDIRGEYGDSQANGRRYSRVYVQAKRGDMVRGSDIQRWISEGVTSSYSFSLQGRFVNGRIEPIKPPASPAQSAQSSYRSGPEPIDPNARYRVERDIRSSYVESAANGRRTGMVYVQANRGDVISGREVQELIKNRIGGFSSFTKLRVGAVGLVAAGLLAQADDSMASTVRLNGDAPEAVRLDGTNAGISAGGLEEEAYTKPSKAVRTAK